MADEEAFVALTDGAGIIDPVPRLVYEYWLDKRGDRAMPDRADLDPPFEITQVLPYTSLIEAVPGDPPDFRYRLVGTAMVPMVGRDMTGRLVSEVPHPRLREMALRSFTTVIETGLPWHHRLTRMWTGNLTYERVLLPLTRGGTRAAMVMLVAAQRSEMYLIPAFETMERGAG